MDIFFCKFMKELEASQKVISDGIFGRYLEEIPGDISKKIAVRISGIHGRFYKKKIPQRKF